MTNKIIVIRTLKQLDYLLTKFKNNIEVYTKPDGGLNTPKMISRHSKNCHTYYAMEDKDKRIVDEEIILEELENILDTKKYFAIVNETKIGAYSSVLGFAMTNHRLLFRIPINPLTNLEENDFLDEYDSLEDIKDGDSYLREHNKGLVEGDMVYVYDAFDDIPFPIYRKFIKYDGSRVLIESTMFHRDVYRYDFATKEKPSEEEILYSRLSYHRYNMMHKKVKYLGDGKLDNSFEGVCDYIYMDGRDVMCIINNTDNERKEFFLDETIVLL